MPEFEGVPVLTEAVRALEVEPEDLGVVESTCSTLQFMTGTSSLRVFSLRQFTKFSSRKLHSVLGRELLTRPGPRAAIACPWLSSVIINIAALISTGTHIPHSHLHPFLCLSLPPPADWIGLPLEGSQFW